MNKNFFAGLFTGLCLLTIFAFKSTVEKPVAVQKWEYYRISVATTSVADAQMKVAGMQGWELVATLGNQTYLFKRPKI